MKVLVAGASGFVGRRLCAALADAGHDVAAMTRNPAGYNGAGTPVYGNVHAPVTLHAPMVGCQVAYYLVHSLSDPDFRRKDAAAAAAFGEAAAQAGLQRIIYLGGLGELTGELIRCGARDRIEQKVGHNVDVACALLDRAALPARVAAALQSLATAAADRQR